MGIRCVRDRRGLSQNELAELLDVSQAAVSAWENGRAKPCRKMRAKLCSVLRCSEEELTEAEG